MVARDGWASFEGAPGQLERALMAVEDPSTRRELLAAYAACVDTVSNEIWRYRPELSLIPPVAE